MGKNNRHYPGNEAAREYKRTDSVKFRFLLDRPGRLLMIS